MAGKKSGKVQEEKTHSDRVSSAEDRKTIDPTALTGAQIGARAAIVAAIIGLVATLGAPLVSKLLADPQPPIENKNLTPTPDPKSPDADEPKEIPQVVAQPPLRVFSNISNDDRHRPNFSLFPPPGATGIRVMITGPSADTARLNIRKDVRFFDQDIARNVMNGDILPARRYEDIFWEIRGVKQGTTIEIRLELVPP